MVGDAALAGLEALAEKWDRKYPAISRCWTVTPDLEEPPDELEAPIAWLAEGRTPFYRLYDERIQKAVGQS